MGKRKNQTQIKVLTKKTIKILKDSKTKGKIFSLSTSNILKSTKVRNYTIAKNIYRLLHKLSTKSNGSNQRRLMSALNIPSQNQIACSVINIPSIENMLVSKKELIDLDYNDEECSQSVISFIQSMSYCIIESQPELMLSYIYLVQKAIKKLGITLSSKQNQKLFMGVWNILIKFWTDDFEQNQYPNINPKIQWGLLQLLNFDLKVGKKQRILIQTKIRSLSYLQD